MLTKEVLTSNEALKGLTDEQLTVISTLSQNDENQVIAKRIGEIHGQYDNDIKSIIGQDKPNGTKTYEWLKSVLTDYKTKSGNTDEYQSQIESLKSEKLALEQQIKDGKIDGAAKSRIEQLEKSLSDKDAQISQWQSKYDTDFKEWESKVNDSQNKYVGLQINYEFERALQGVKFKDEKVIPLSVRESYLNFAKQGILSENNPDWIDDGKGGKKLAFRGKDGEILRNPENSLNPYTAKELLLKRISDIVDTGKQQNGTGTKPNGNGNQSYLDLTGVTSQVQADNTIFNHLMALGLRRGTAEFSAKQKELRDANDVNKLPIK